MQCSKSDQLLNHFVGTAEQRNRNSYATWIGVQPLRRLGSSGCA
jgi:hypothetical protein